LLLFQPWIEGLALFAQWDSLPGESKAASKAMLTASGLYFLSNGIRNLSDGYVEFANVIKRGRATYDAHRRKTDLLSQPLSDVKGAYLAGYLSVKALYKKKGSPDCPEVSRYRLFYNFRKRAAFSRSANGSIFAGHAYGPRSLAGASYISSNGQVEYLWF
jgi:hypothetical protein